MDRVGACPSVYRPLVLLVRGLLRVPRLGGSPGEGPQPLCCGCNYPDR